MSQENVQIAQGVFDAWKAGDMDAVRDLYDPDVVVRPLEGWPEPGPLLGRDAVMRQWERQRDTWDADVVEPVGDFIDAADRVVVRQVWRGAGHGPDMNMEMTNVFMVRKGKIVYQEFFWDHDEALEVLGLSDRAMSQENIAIYRAYIEDILSGTRDLDSEATISKMAEHWDPQIEQDTSGGPVPELSGVYRGQEAVRQWWKEWFSAWETMQAKYDLVAAGDRVAFLLDLRMRGRSSGIEVALGKHAWVTTFRNGLMVHTKLYMSQSDALEALGLSEQDAHPG